MEYNTGRDYLIIPEYGRNIQIMIRHLLTIEDREKRSLAAAFIVNVMAQMNPQVRESLDYKHKLWDHLHIISGFKIDVDGPYPPPSQEKLNTKPLHVGYASSQIKYGHYGRYIIDLIQKAIEYEPGEEKDAFVQSIANQMKKSYLNWNKDAVSDTTIAENLANISNGKLVMPDDIKLVAASDVLTKTNPVNINKKKKFGVKKDMKQGFQHRNPRQR
ncbi:MAG: DUF4290 domain-containing protein [Bacteroidales bacterium]|nr:DUF4290 domain-containing protein [Bacteroidales bacterium]